MAGHLCRHSQHSSVGHGAGTHLHRCATYYEDRSRTEGGPRGGHAQVAQAPDHQQVYVADRDVQERDPGGGLRRHRVRVPVVGAGTVQTDWRDSTGHAVFPGALVFADRQRDLQRTS
uniref:(northern house mosquito) hypothetical protein n=1 Tax=Culex pipiens TaxID=7175 RepID=A0A8D8MR12_CULPI